jgi:hypothetical protein
LFAEGCPSLDERAVLPHVVKVECDGRVGSGVFVRAVDGQLFVSTSRHVLEGSEQPRPAGRICGTSSAPVLFTAANPADIRMHASADAALVRVPAAFAQRPSSKALGLPLRSPVGSLLGRSVRVCGWDQTRITFVVQAAAINAVWANGMELNERARLFQRGTAVCGEEPKGQMMVVGLLTAPALSSLCMECVDASALLEILTNWQREESEAGAAVAAETAAAEHA